MLFNVNPAEHQCLGIAEIKPLNFSIEGIFWIKKARIFMRALEKPQKVE
tara:strand:- start:95 stop:241 length:147 start_codon:yes stop_codon:yes gene_type:complete